MLRTVGSSLLAKASPGGAMRKVDETNVESPALPGKGGLGTVSRGLLEQPIERQVPPGSSKTVSSAPSVEPSAAPAGILPTQPIGNQNGIGLPDSAPVRGAVAPPVPNVGLLQPTLRSGVASGVKAKTASGGEVLGAGVASAYRPQETNPVSIQGEPGQQNDPNWINAISGNVGGKVIANEPGRATSAPQTRSGAANIAQKLGAPSGVVNYLSNAQPIGSAVRSLAVNNPVTRTAQAGQAVASALKSYNPVQTFKSNVGKAVGALRSLFGR